jgi:4-amino-4-deoxy-L-arabinose transferase-like glycosyltransferase
MSDGRLAAFLFLAAFLARLVLALGTLIFGTDGGQMLYMADRMSEGRFHEALSVTYHPFYPFLVSVLRTFLGSTERAGFGVSIALGSAAVVPLFLLTRAIFGRPAAFITGLIFAFHPYTLDVHADVMTEGTFVFFLCSSMWLGWRSMEDPAVERGVLAGLTAAAAYLTRAEGMLVMALVPAWQGVDLLLRRDRWAARLGSIGLGIAAMVILLFPFLLWVKSVHPEKKWGASAKYSVTQAGAVQEVGYGARAGRVAFSLVRMMFYVGVPFYLLGLLGLRGLEARKALFFLSFPLLHLAGLFWALQKVPYMSYRYVIPVMNLMAVVMALGVIQTIRYLSRRLPDPRWVLAAQAVVLVAAVGVGVRAFGVHRVEDNIARDVAAWIRSQGGTERGIFTSLDQAGYLSGTRSFWYPSDWEGFNRAVDARQSDYFVYTDRDLKSGRPDYLGRLPGCDRLEPSHVIHGKWTVYIQRAKP